MSISKQRLKQFCGDDEIRSWLNVPFNQGGFTWATDGRILIRVPENDGFLPCSSSKPVNISKPIDGVDAAQFAPARLVLPPHDPTFKGPCVVCEGRGHLHDCPACECTCEACNGEGMADPERRMSTFLFGRIFALNYVRLIADLPGLEISDNGGGERPLFFRFEGGVGGIMPMRSQHDTHVEIEVAS